jgi:uncharacterized ParB-like nuclease family protein
MKNIQDILEKKRVSAGSGEKRELDKKTIGRVFVEAAEEEIGNLEDVDILETNLKGKNLYIKTAHPVVSSELVLRREKIIKKVNEIAGSEVIEKIYIN